LTSLSGFFKPAIAEGNDSDKLQNLYWNRAELKKEFAALRDEKYRLQERIKQHEGATARVQQKMIHLENLLLDRDWVHNVVVFYQMRRLGAHCHAKLNRFAEQLKRQYERRVHSKTMHSWNEERAQNTAVIESDLEECRLQVQCLEDQLESQRHKALTAGILTRLFRGRRLDSDLHNIERQIEAGKGRERELSVALDTEQARCPPNHEGLSIAQKRNINFMILSFAQGLYLHFAEDDLAQLAKEASDKSVGAVNYGNKGDCDHLLKLLEERSDTSGQVSDLADTMRKRAATLAKYAQFRQDDDAVPVPRSVSTIYDIGTNGFVRERDGNLLGENYFGITKVLSR
jgi:hypothetical protein